jgi:DNA-binding NtrC family response regulator
MLAITMTKSVTTQLIIVDDDFDLRDSLEAYFDTPEFNVISYSSGKTLLEQLPNNFNGVIVCDLKMPEMSGLQVLEALQSIPDSPPVILMTAFGDVPIAVKAMNLGAYDFIEKPFEPTVMREKILQAANTRRIQTKSQPLDEKIKLREYVENFEKSLLEQGLRECSGHIGKVCDLLNIPRRTLNEKLLKHGINRQNFLS